MGEVNDQGEEYEEVCSGNDDIFYLPNGIATINRLLRRTSFIVQ